jgi:hypothetical protein
VIISEIFQVEEFTSIISDINNSHETNRQFSSLQNMYISKLVYDGWLAVLKALKVSSSVYAITKSPGPFFSGTHASSLLNKKDPEILNSHTRYCSSGLYRHTGTSDSKSRG